jgi:hypothetical protein
MIQEKALTGIGASRGDRCLIVKPPYNANGQKSKAAFVCDRTAEGAAMSDRVKAHQLAIKAAWQKQVSSIIETGKLLIAAKEDLRYRKWGGLFEGENALPFRIDTAEALMKIARHPVLSNPERAPELPAAWTVLEMLARAKPARLEKWLRDGTVNAATSRLEADCLTSPKWEPKRVFIADPEPEVKAFGTIDMADLRLLSPSAERNEMLKALQRIGYNLADEEISDGEEEPMESESACKTSAYCLQIDEVLTYIELEQRLLGGLRGSELAKFEEWVSRTICRLQRLRRARS